MSGGGVTSPRLGRTGPRYGDVDEVREVGLQGSPSCCWNNLDSTGYRVTWVHGDTVLAWEPSGGSMRDAKEGTSTVVGEFEGHIVSGLRCCLVGGVWLVVVTGTHGVRAYDDASGTCVLDFGLPADEVVATRAPEAGCMAGVAHCVISEGGGEDGQAGQAAAESVVVGSSTGRVYVFRWDAEACVLVPEVTVEDCKESLCCLSTEADSTRGKSSGSMLVAGGMTGKIHVWDVVGVDAFVLKAEIFPGSGRDYPAVSARVMQGGKNFLVGFGDGLVSVYSIVGYTKIAHIQVCSRYLAAMDYLPGHEHLAVVSEDSTVNVLDLSNLGHLKLAMAYSHVWDNRMCTGVTYAGKDLGTLAVSAYDTDMLRLMPITL